jgi:hypothetical protein
MTYRTYGPAFLWVDFDDLVEGCLVDVRIAETHRGWAITDLCISLAPPEPLRDQIDYGGIHPRLSDFAVYPFDSYETIRGITSKHLQAIKLDVIRQTIADDTDGEEMDDPEWTSRLKHITESMRTGRHNRRDDLFYAEVAAVYVDITRDTKRGIYQIMADRLPLAASSLSDVVKEARKRQLLTRPIAGRSGGTLTPKAIELLEGNRP